ncbi:hypothetical protein QE377_002495 [Microbacterium sp. SORGH_AS 862]|nr:hypothetical protein [Microbacterium sp. SORGH_AS_0862]
MIGLLSGVMITPKVSNLLKECSEYTPARTTEWNRMTRMIASPLRTSIQSTRVELEVNN